MEFYWRLKDIPELKSLDKGERTEVWVATMGRRMRDPWLLLLLIPYFVIVGLCNYLGGLLIPWEYGSSICGGIGAGLSIFLSSTVIFQRSRPHFAEEIHRRSLK